MSSMFNITDDIDCGHEETRTAIQQHKVIELKLKFIYDRQSVGQSVLVSGTHLGPATNLSFPLKSSLDSCGFIILQRPL
jgi:hypothetical protein